MVQSTFGARGRVATVPFPSLELTFVSHPHPTTCLSTRQLAKHTLITQHKKSPKQDLSQTLAVHTSHISRWLRWVHQLDCSYSGMSISWETEIRVDLKERNKETKVGLIGDKCQPICHQSYLRWLCRHPLVWKKKFHWEVPIRGINRLKKRIKIISQTWVISFCKI